MKKLTMILFAGLGVFIVSSCEQTEINPNKQGYKELKENLMIVNPQNLESQTR